MAADFEAVVDEAIAALQGCKSLSELVTKAGGEIVRCLRAGGTVAFCGNGGSAAQAQHFAAELVGRFELERPAFRAIALTTDTSILTAIGNDYDFADVFARQVQGLLSEGDVLVAISTSGNAENVCRAAEQARRQGVKVIGLTGRDGGRLAALCDIELRVPAQVTARIQEGHLLLGHFLCRYVERALAER